MQSPTYMTLTICLKMLKKCYLCNQTTWHQFSLGQFYYSLNQKSCSKQCHSIDNNTFVDQQLQNHTECSLHCTLWRYGLSGTNVELGYNLMQSSSQSGSYPCQSQLCDYTMSFYFFHSGQKDFIPTNIQLNRFPEYLLYDSCKRC